MGDEIPRSYFQKVNIVRNALGWEAMKGNYEYIKHRCDINIRLKRILHFRDFEKRPNLCDEWRQQKSYRPHRNMAKK